MTEINEGSQSHNCTCGKTACIEVSCGNNKPLSSVIDADRDSYTRLMNEKEQIDDQITSAYNNAMRAFENDVKVLRWQKEVVERALLRFSRPGCFGAFGRDVMKSNGEYVCRCDNCKHGVDCYHADEARRGEI